MAFIKVSILVLALVATCFAGDKCQSKPEDHELGEKCIKQVKDISTDEELMAVYRNHSAISSEEWMDINTCCYQDRGYLDANNQLNTDKINADLEDRSEDADLIKDLKGVVKDCVKGIGAEEGALAAMCITKGTIKVCLSS